MHRKRIAKHRTISVPNNYVLLVISMQWQVSKYINKANDGQFQEPELPFVYHDIVFELKDPSQGNVVGA